MAKNAVKFYKEVKQEGKKVTWPTRKEVTVTTVIVFILVIIIALFLMLADTVVSAGIEAILGLGTN